MSTDPLWINADAGSPAYAADELRRNMAMLLSAGVTDRLGARAGVRPGGSDAITLSGQTVSVHPTPVTVYPGLSSTDGPYVGHLLADTHTLDPADGANDRIDIVVVRVYDDDHDSSGRRELVTEYIAGTPAPSPTPPAAPAGAFVGAEILVPAGGSPSPTLNFVAPFTVASGGVLPVRSAVERPAAGLYAGLMVYRQDTDILEVWDGSGWVTLASTFEPFKGYVQDPEGLQTTSTTPVYTGTSITVPSARNPAGARFKVMLTGHLSSTSNDDNGELSIRRGTSPSDPLVVAARRHNLRSSGMEVSMFRVDDPPPGAVTYGIFVRRVSGSGTINLTGTAEFEAALSVEFYDFGGT